MFSVAHTERTQDCPCESHRLWRISYSIYICLPFVYVTSDLPSSACLPVCLPACPCHAICGILSCSLSTNIALFSVCCSLARAVAFFRFPGLYAFELYTSLRTHRSVYIIVSLFIMEQFWLGARLVQWCAITLRPTGPGSMLVNASIPWGRGSVLL